MNGDRKEHVVGFRVTPAERARLDAMAEATGRTVSNLLRVLVQSARLTGHPDVIAEVDPGQEVQS